jgi:hypothetical protein
MGLSQEYIDRVSAENPIFKKFFELARYDNFTPEEKEIYDKEEDRRKAELYNDVARCGAMRAGIEIAIKLRDEGVLFEIISNATGIRLTEIEKLSLEILK